MPRYIECETACAEVDKGDLLVGNNAEFAKEIINRTPIADVVPKSEVDSEIKVWQDLYADTVSKWEKAYEELEIKLENTKAEVAREIFEEIEPVFMSFCLSLEAYRAWVNLKKKYTGDGV